MTSLETIRWGLERAYDAGRIDNVHTGWWAKTHNRRPGEIAELVASIKHDRATKVVPVGDLHRFAGEDGK